MDLFQFYHVMWEVSRSLWLPETWDLYGIVEEMWWIKSWSWFTWREMWILSYCLGWLCSDQNSMLASQAFQATFLGISHLFFWVSYYKQVGFWIDSASSSLWSVFLRPRNHFWCCAQRSVKVQCPRWPLLDAGIYLFVFLMWFCFPSQWPGYGEHTSVSSEPDAWRGGRGNFTVLQVRPISVTVFGRHLILLHSDPYRTYPL